MGWIYESIYCTIRAKKWENRGFLYGPLCLIYGAGGVATTAIADLISITRMRHLHGGRYLRWHFWEALS